MKKKFTFLIAAAVMLLTMVANPLRVLADDVLYYTLTPTATGGNTSPHNDYTKPATITLSNIEWSVTGNSSMVPWRIGGKSITAVDRDVHSNTAMNSAISEVKLTVGAASNITVNSLKLLVYNNSDYADEHKIDEVSVTFAANSTLSFKPTSPATDWATGAYYKFVFNLTVSGTSNKFVEFTEAKFYAPNGSLEDSDLALTGAPIDLNFDLYNNSDAQIVNYTTSSTGAVTVSGGSSYVTTSVNENDKTITVTPTAVTPSAQTITVNQAADENYAAGSATFTVSITNSTPQYTVTYKANGGTGDDILINYDEGANVIVAANTFVYAGHAFTKWNTVAGGTGTDYNPEDVIENISANIDLYAQWEESTTVIDILNASFTGNPSSYTDWSGTGSSSAVYAGNSSGSTDYIQIRATSPSGIVTTTSGGFVKKISVTWDGSTVDGRTLNVYGSNTAYNGPGDLYGQTPGTIIGTIVKGTSTELSVATDYYYIGLRSNSGAMYLDEIQITWEPDNDPAVTTTVNINDANINNDCGNNNTDGGTFSAVVKDNEDQVINNAIVTWTSSNTDIATINESTGAVTLVAVGTTTITANYAGVANEYKPSSATYTLNVINSYAPGGEHNPYTVAQARDAIDAASGATLYAKYATGIISEVVYYSESNHYITYNISDDGETTSNQLQAFHGKGIGGANFAAEDDLQVGDRVVVYGNLLFYNSSSTYEFAADNQLVSLVRKTIAVTPTSIESPAAGTTGSLSIATENITITDLEEFDVQFYNNQDEAISNPGWITFGDFSGSGNSFSVGYTIETTTEAREAYFKVFTITDEVYSNLITITQAAPVSIEYYQYSINGVEGDLIETTAGSVINLPSTVADIPEDYTFAGWTIDATNVTVNNILAPGSSYTITETVEFFAVYSKTTEITGSHIVILDGEATGLSSTASAVTISENGFSYYTSNAKKQAVPGDAENAFTNNYAILIGKSGANLYNTTPFGQGITKFEVYANKGAAQAVTVGINFSTDVIEEYDENVEHTWTANLNPRDCVYDASEALLSGAKYFWYQVTNANNSQVQFRITYTSTESTTSYYTRVYASDAPINANTDITITTPTVISDGSVLNMGEYTLTCTDPANLVIEDGGQLVFNNDNVQATMKKSTAHAGAKAVGDWYTIASPLAANVATDGVTHLTTGISGYDLYRYDEESSMWENIKAHGDFTQLEVGRGYLYWNADGVDIEFAGKLRNDDVTYNLTADGTGTYKGMNLIGNPFSQNITVSNITGATLTGGYVLSKAGAWSAEITEFKPCQGFLVQVNAAKNITISKSAAKSRANRNYIAFTVANSQYEDVTYAMFEEGLGLNKINHRNANIPMLYIAQNDENYAIATMSDETQSFNLNFKAMTTGQYTLSYKAEGNYDYLHVIDRLTGEDIDMLLDGEYSFIASPSDNDARFIVRLGYNANGNVENDIFAYQNGSDIVVNGEGELQVFDVTGRMVATQHVNGIQTVNVPSQGVFIFKLNEKTQKIVVR